MTPEADVSDPKPSLTTTLGAALAAAQGELRDPAKTGRNPHFGSSFVPLDGVLQAIRPVLSRHGIALTQLLDVLDSGVPILVTRLWVGDGQGPNEIVSRMLLPQSNDPQKMRSAVTYARRTALEAIAGVAGSDDDDGEAATRGRPAAARAPAPPAKHASWAADRAAFCARLAELGTSYDDVAAACETKWGRRPSSWPRSKRDGLLRQLEDGSGFEVLGLLDDDAAADAPTP